MTQQGSDGGLLALIDGPGSDQRGTFRRYADRRGALMLAVYERLFDDLPGPGRDQKVLEAMIGNFQADRALLVLPRFAGAGAVEARACAGQWPVSVQGRVLSGPGVKLLLELHNAAPGTLTLTKVKRPSAFSADAWDSLWSTDLGASAMALLSAGIHPQKASPQVLWLIQTGYSREWSSRDRELAEEVATVLGKAADRALTGN